MYVKRTWEWALTLDLVPGCPCLLAEGVLTGITIKQIDSAVERWKVVHFVGAVTRIGLQIRLIQGPTNLWDGQSTRETIEIERPIEGRLASVACQKEAAQRAGKSVHESSSDGC